MKPLGELRVKDLMTHDVCCVNDTDRLTDVIRLMDQNWYQLVPVVDAQGALVGVLSTSDLMQRFYRVQADLSALHVANETLRDLLIQIMANEGDNTCVRDVMRDGLFTVSENSNAIVAAQTLIDKAIHHLPVVDETNRPIGIISSTDFVKAIASQGAMLAG